MSKAKEIRLKERILDADACIVNLLEDKTKLIKENLHLRYLLEKAKTTIGDLILRTQDERPNE